MAGLPGGFGDFPAGFGQPRNASASWDYTTIRLAANHTPGSQLVYAEVVVNNRFKAIYDTSLNGKVWFTSPAALSRPAWRLPAGLRTWGFRPTGGYTWESPLPKSTISPAFGNPMLAQTQWHSITSGSNGLVPHTDAQVFAFDPFQGKVYYGNDGGLYRYNPVPAKGRQLPKLGSWDDLNDSGVQTTLNYSIAVGSDPAVVLSGSQDNGIQRTTNATGPGNPKSQMGLGGDGIEVRFAPSDPLIVYALQQNGFLNRSTNGGQTWKYVGAIPVTDRRTFPFRSAFAVNPTDPNNVIIGSKTAVWQTTDGGTTWNTISPTLVADSAITALTFAPDANGQYGQIIFVAYKGGEAFVTQNGGGNWSASVNPPWNNSRISSIITDPNTPGTAYLSVSEFDTEQVFVTNDYGVDWQPINGDPQNGGLPNVPVNSLVYDQEDGYTVLYAGTDIGVYRGVEGANSWVWTRFGDSMPYVKVTDMQILQAGGSEYLYASTYGRGNWRVQIPVAPVVLNVMPLTITQQLVEGAALQGIKIATFTSSDPAGTASQFSAIVQWGDGDESSSAQNDLTIQADPTLPGVFDVIASKPNSYDEGDYPAAPPSAGPPRSGSIKLNPLREVNW